MLDIKYIKECPDEVIARLAMKGKDIEEELEQAKPLIKSLGGQVKEVQLHTLSDEEITHSIVVIEKISNMLFI